MLSEHAEEILEALAVQMEEQGKKPLDLGMGRDDPAIEELVKLGYIRKDVDHIHLLDKGKSEAQKALRRHRLAERSWWTFWTSRTRRLMRSVVSLSTFYTKGWKTMSVLSWGILRSAPTASLFHLENAAG